MILITTRFLKNYSGMTLWPVLLVSHRNRALDPIFMNHERIHARQQQELLIIPFFLWYAVEFLILRLTRTHAQAYRSIVFEREAYAMEHDLDYLKNRKWYRFIRFYGKKYRV